MDGVYNQALLVWLKALSVGDYALDIFNVLF